MSDLKLESIALIIPDFDFGGEEKRVLYFANSYVAEFNSVFLFSPKGKSLDFLDSRVEHIEFKKNNLYYFLKLFIIIKLKKIKFLQGHKRAIIPHLFFCEKLLNVVCVFNFDNIYLNRNKIFKYIVPSKIIYLSKVLCDFYDKIYSTSENKVIEMGGDFVTLPSLHEVKTLKVNFDSQCRVIILCVGRLTHQKNHKLLFKALSLLDRRDFVLLLAGEGPYEQQLRSYSNELGLSTNISFLGHVRDLNSVYSVADFAVQSSIFEGFPNFLIEAASASLPIVATDVGSTKSIVLENGMLVPCGDFQSLSEAISLMMQNLSFFKIKAQQFRMSSEFNHMHKSRMLNEYVEYYKSL